MSWFNLNDSFNNIKGQITSLASEVLSEGNGNNTESNAAIEELQQQIALKETQIQSLKNENDLLKLQQKTQLVKENEAGNDDGWSWDLPETKENPNAVITDLKKKIEELEAEKKDLLISLDQLDLDCQEATDKLVTIKDELQLEHNQLKLDFADLKQKHDYLTKINAENLKRIKHLESGVVLRNAALEEKLLELKTECENFKNVELKKLRKKFDEVKSVTKKLQALRETSNESLQSEDCARLENILHEYETKLSSYENELISLKKSNSKLEAQVLENQNTIELLKKEKQEALAILEVKENELQEERNKRENTKMDTQKENMDVKIETIGNENKELRLKLEAVGMKNRELNVKLGDFETENGEIKMKLEALEKENEELMGLLNAKQCDLQQEKIKTEKSKKIQEETIQAIEMEKQESIKRLVDEKDEIEEKKRKAEVEVEILKQKYEDLLAELTRNRNDENKQAFEGLELKYREEVEKHKGERNKLEEEISMQKGKIEELVKSCNTAMEKCSILEKTISDLKLEKSQIITEKNHEIEKLIRNSDDLSNEIMLKTQDLKHYEEECGDLIKNNELLIARLEEYKNSSNLETISETNEENMLQLEQQLESANKKIEELKREIELKSKIPEGNDQQEEIVSLRFQLQAKSDQLNDTIRKLDESRNKYNSLIKSYEKLENANDSLKVDFHDMKLTYNECFNEKEDLNQTVDQMKSECENTEYKYAEQNINLETLKEEIEMNQLKIDELSSENKRLEMLRVDFEGKNELMGKEIEDLKQELTATLDVLEEKDKSLEDLESALKQAKDLEQNLIAQIEENVNTLNDNEAVLKGLRVSLEEAEVLKGNLNRRIEELINEENKSDSAKITEEALRLHIEELIKENVKINELKQAAEQNCNRFSLDVSNFHKKIADLSKTCDGLLEQNAIILTENTSLKDELKILKERRNEQNQGSDEINKLNTALQERTAELNKLNMDFALNQSVDLEKIKALESQVIELTQSRNQLSELIKTKTEENSVYHQEILELQKQIAELNQSKNQVIELIQVKHDENVKYHNEIQRLQQLLTIEIEKSRTYEAQMQNLNTTSFTAEELSKKDEEMEKLADQNNFLREKCTKLAENLLEEQSNLQKVLSERAEASEKELILQKKLDELRRHMVEVEDYYTKEVSNAELACEEMKRKLAEMELREKNSSNRYTSVNIRANQQVETLQTQLQLVTNQRDDLKEKISNQEDEINKQKAALTNLHSAFQQFQREKDKQVQIETERIRRQLAQEKQVQEGLQKEIGDLKVQLEESKQGLKAAVRLSDQVDASKRQVASMKDEVVKLQQQLAKSEEKYNKHINQGDGKVDKMLIKNLIIGLVSSNNTLTKDQNQILKIISTVLDFNQQDIEKVKLNKNHSGSSWFTSLLHPQSLENQNMTQESLSLAFVKFLEAESKPRELPNLLDSASVVGSDGKPTAGSSRTSSVRQSPILLNEIVLPTFADFGQNRNSSSILKDVLKDNNTNS